MKLNLNDIIIEPIISEKSTELSKAKKYVFKVHQAATKTMIKQALEKMFSVKVKECNIINLKGKKRRNRRKNTYSYTPGKKKVIVSLKEGEFDFFETMQ